MDDAASTGDAAPSAAKTDTEKLHEMGYAQELKRGMGAFSNFAVSFTIISILSGCLTLFGYGMFVGGPASSAYGWPLVGILVTFVALAMAEICSSYPTAGGLYYWAAKIAPKNGPAWAWFCGWFNFLGQVAVTAGIDFGFAAFFCAFLHFAFSVEVTKLILIASYTGVLAVHGIMNTFGIRLVALLNDVSVWWHIAGVLVIFGILYFVPDHHTSWATIFSFSTTPKQVGGVPGFINGTGFSSGPFGGTIYIFLIGMLLAQYTLTGYDASAHMTEETHDADVSGPNGVWKSVVYSVIFGYILLLGVWYAMQGQAGYDAAAAFQPATGTVAAPAQIFFDAVGGSKGLTVFMLLIVVGAQFFCGMASVTANSRMIYAFSRDGALPGSKWWHVINKRTRTPTNGIWLAVALAWLLVAPAYWWGSLVAYFAVTSIAVIGLYIAYVIPTFLRLRAGDDFTPGRWNLGKWSKLVGTIAVIWTVFICIMLMMPQFAPNGGKLIDFLNYAPIAVLIVIGFAGIYWLVSARKWFTGPKVMGTPEELKAIELELEQV
ncbi:MAG: amino acid permease [Actinomycetota bacterium]